MKRIFRSGVLALGLSALLFSCGGDDSTVVEEPAIVGDIVKGEEVFKTNCTACHQADGKGKAGFAPSLNNIDFLQVANDQQIKRFILEGRPGTMMMPFKDNAKVAENINDLVAYIRSWKDGFDLYEKVSVDKSWVSQGDAAKGSEMYTSYCAACHGQEGEGYSSGGAGTGIGNAAFLKTTPDAYIKAVMMDGRAGTAMKSFDKAKGLANLDQSQMDDIVAFLRSKQAYEKPAPEAAK